MKNDNNIKQKNGEWLGKIHLEMAIRALNIIKKYYGDNYTFPIDIEEIAKNAGFDVIYMPLNSSTNPNMRYHKTIVMSQIRKNMVTLEKEKKFLIDDQSAQFDQRYALAFEFARFLLKTKELYSSEYHMMTILDMEVEEIEIEILASFILLPLPLFIKEYDKFIGTMPIPEHTYEWLRYLSTIAKVPYENTVTGYQNIRYALCAARTLINQNIPECEWPGFENLEEPIDEIKMQLINEPKK